MRPEELEELRNRINSFPPILQPKAERVITSAQRMELIRLVMEYKKFDAVIRENLHKVDDNVLYAADQTARDALYNKKTRTARFDGVAFMEAIDEAMKNFDPTAGARFLTYFDMLYGQRLIRSAREQTNIAQGNLFTKLSATDVKLLKQTARLVEQSGLSLKELSAEFYSQIATEMHTTPDRVRALLQSISNAKHVESIYLPDRDESGNSLDADSDGDNLLAHDAAEDTEEMGHNIELLEEVANALEAFADADAKEFPRLFMSNDVLSPLKETDGDAFDYAQLLLRYETMLRETIFILNYLCYAFVAPPEPTNVKNVVQANLRYPLQDKTIADYKGVSKAAISQQRKKYSVLWQEYRKISDCMR